MRVLYVAFVLSAAVTINVARYCYVCDNASDETCEDRYFGEHETDCEPVPPYDGGCSKFKTKTGIYGLEVYTVTRSCNEAYNNSHCLHMDRQILNVVGITTEQWECSCYGDRCNGDSQIAFSSALIIAALAKYLL